VVGPEFKALTALIIMPDLLQGPEKGMDMWLYYLQFTQERITVIFGQSFWNQEVRSQSTKLKQNHVVSCLILYKTG
jgi:hypothetical protein